MALAVDREEFLLALDASREVLSRWDQSNEDERTTLVRIYMNYAEALSRVGHTRTARQTLERLIDDDFTPKLGSGLKSEILVQLGSIWREESHYLTVREAELYASRQGLDCFRRASQVNPENEEALVLKAAMSFYLGEPGAALRQEAQADARLILGEALKRENHDGPRRRTTLAIAIAYTILEDVDKAADSYRKLAGMEGATTAELASARYYAQFYAQALGKPRDYFKSAFPPLDLIVFAGHLPDRPGAAARLPNSAIREARDALFKKLSEMNARVGLTSASAGADLLFIESLNKLHGTVHLVLPWSQDEFRRTSVRPYEPDAHNPIWEPIFDQAIANAATIREIGQVYEPSDDVGWDFMMEVSAGIALQAARALRLDIKPLVLWDGLPGRGAGGTDDFHSFWRNQLQFQPEIVPPPVDLAVKISRPSGERRRKCERTMLHQEVKTMLFADIVGYSKLTEKVIPDFVGVFLERVSQLAATSQNAPRNVNTWGDAVYAVFDFARDAGLFALELTKMIEEGRADWIAKGLYWEEITPHGNTQHPLSVRIGLHTGPVFLHYDPVVRRLGFTGAHVNRAARIEPIAKPGEVYASEEFAAMAELTSQFLRIEAGSPPAPELGFVCEYAGSMPLAKGYPGRHRIYRVVPRPGFALDTLAQAAHAAFCAEAEARGERRESNPSMRPWDELSEDLRDANRAQVADIPNKLRFLGYELATSHGMSALSIKVSDQEVEEMAALEHERWMAERKRNGWIYGPKRDNARKHHPLMVPWKDLTEPDKDKDRDTIRHFPQLVEKAGFRVRRLNEV
ncbi:MAG TPA: RyR domain-containing protein [Bryobacteraceae bacterium]|nr:RyR domain-containing protein [Bryobacteraceae bacterium]